ncbi:hypothetical protein [Pontibacter oryzae]|nr:hypothetical protein [Pontibacter oryzae]
MNKRDDEIRYYHGGLGAEENRRDFDRNTRDGDFGREYENRYRHRQHPQDYRNRRDFDAHRFEDYDRHANELNANYNRNTHISEPYLSDIRQGYGIPEFRRLGSEPHNRLDDMERERRAQQQQAYNTGRPGGYSGAAYGGSNYSTHGDFGGAPGNGAMSGAGGNSENYTSSSGYGGGHGSPSIHDSNAHRRQEHPHNYDATAGRYGRPHERYNNQRNRNY